MIRCRTISRRSQSIRAAAVQPAVGSAIVIGLILFFLLSIPLRAASPEEVLRQAQQLEQSGALQRAADLYLDFLKANPEHSQSVEVRFRLGKCYDSMGMVDEAIAELNRAAAAGVTGAFRNRPDALFMLAKLQASIKNHDDAIVALETLLREGAGLYEDEALNLCGGYYGIKGKYTEAAAKFNILRNKTGSSLAEQAGYKLALLWLKADKLDLALDAIQDFANRRPRNDQIPDLLLRAADGFRRQRQWEKTIALCDQLRTRYPKTNEAIAAIYLIGLCQRDRKEFQKAADTLDGLGKVTAPAVRLIAADALLQAADIYAVELTSMDKAIPRYEEAAKLARDAPGERQFAILEQCHFRIAEHHFAKDNWSVALEHYLHLRHLGSSLNILGRILKCQAELDAGQLAKQFTDADLKLLEEKIKSQPGTVVAAEAELFLLDRQLARAIRERRGTPELAVEYEKMFAKYPRSVLGVDHLEVYILAQAGYAWSHGQDKADWLKAIAAYDKALQAGPGPANPYRVPCLENLALVAERAGDKPRAMQAYRELLAISAAQLDHNKPDPNQEQKTLDYLKSLVTRSDSADLIKDSLAMCQQMIEKHGALSNLAREARYAIAELHYVNKDFSAAARAFDDFIRAHGPSLDADGNFANGPVSTPNPDPAMAQVFEAALRRAHCWFMQGHHQNMIKAYQWIARNTPEPNPRAAEAHYWLALEQLKGEQGKSKETKLQTAAALWTNVVNSSLDFDDGNFRKSYRSWTAEPKSAADRAAQNYVKHAILRAGQLYNEAGSHEIASRILEQFLAQFPSTREREKGRRGELDYDELYDMARYTLGRSYAALDNAGKLVECYRPYLDQMRESPYRVSALKLTGYHAGQDGRYPAAFEAYAALLDEYGTNQTDDKGNVVPMRRELWLRSSRTWDGIRMPTPKDLDQAEIRFALGFLYWRQEQWNNCVKTLASFVEEPAWAKNKSADKALYMLARSYINLFGYARAATVLQKLVHDHPRFEAVEEAMMQLGRCLAETRNWADFDALYRKFIAEWPKSDKRHRMELYAALSLIGQNKAPEGLANLKSLAGGDTFEDVKADAAYHLGLHALTSTPPNHREALTHFERSIAVYPREAACLEAARCHMALKQWDQARVLLDRVGRDFPKGDARVIHEARRLMSDVVKELAKQPAK